LIILIDRADAHYLASARAQDALNALLQDLISALSRPATSSEHQRLSEILDDARRLLPEAIGPSFPRPSHPSYPEHDAHNDHLVHMLARSHADVESALKEAQTGLEWYHKLTLASENLVELKERVEKDFRILQTEVNALEHGDPDHGRPSLSDPSFNFDDNTWVTEAPSRLLSIRASRETLQESNQRLAVQILRSRQIEQFVPRFLDTTSEKSIHNVVGQAADLSDLASEGVDRAQQACKAAEDDLAILPLLRNVLSSAPALRQGLKSLSEEATMTDDSLTVDSVTALADRLQLLRRDYTSNVDEPIQAIRHVLEQQGRALTSVDDQLTEITRDLGEAISGAQLRIDHLKSIMEQRIIINNIEAEAAEHTSRIELVQLAINAFVQGSVDAETSETTGEEMVIKAKTASDTIGEWVGGLAARVRFVEPLVEKALDIGDIDTDKGLNTSVDGTSSSSPIAGQAATNMNDLRGARNLEARRRVNEAAARVQSAVSHLDRSAQSAVPGRLRTKVVQELDNIDATLSQMSRDVDGAESRLDSLSTPMTPGKDMLDARNVLDELRDVENRLDSLLEAPAIDDLNSLLQSRIADIAELPSSHQETRMDMDDDLHKRLAVLAEVRQRAEALLLRFQSTIAKMPQAGETADHDGLVSDTIDSSDVFGTVANIYTKEQLEHDFRGSSIKELRKRLEQLQLDQILYPSKAALRSTPAYRQIPSSPVAKRIREELKVISLAFASSRQERLSPNETEEDVIALSSALQIAEEGSKRLDDLVAVSQSVKAADEAFSGLLDVLDEHDAGERIASSRRFRGEDCGHCARVLPSRSR
jgi:hypothetical protein